jgi:hypothetical protein
MYHWDCATSMVQNHTPYDYGEAETDAIGDDPTHEQQHGADTVIVDGSVMSYRSYTSAEE